jgi:L-threonylcarbamoyladenylate synthase
VRAHLEGGGIIAYPTETVYGFGCALVPDALARLAAMKGREGVRPFLLLHRNPVRLPGLQWNDAARVLASRFWPGALTIALTADPDRYEKPVLSNEGTVAVRHTSHKELQTLLAAIDRPITSTSANAAGAPPALSADDVFATLRTLGVDDILVLDGGPIPATAPSTVVDCAAAVPRIVRVGAISAAVLRAALAPGGFTIDE